MSDVAGAEVSVPEKDVEMRDEGNRGPAEEEVLDYEDGANEIEGAAEQEPEEEDIPIDIETASDPFYLRYYSGHQGKYGHEFLEFDIRVQDDGSCAILRYANNSNYRNEGLIKKEATLSPSVFKEFKRIIKDSEILKEDDYNWPEKNRDGKQELEVRLGRFHISFETAKIGSLNDVQQSDDPEGLRVFYYLVQDLKAFVFSLMSLHFKIKPI